MTVQRVAILNTDRPVPTYHRLTDVVFEDGVHVGVMACGHRTPPHAWWSAHLRRDHADHFARPCSVCFFQVAS